ncbi:dihydropyrimidinase [Variovorax fucosicus]|uniref:dihydropyrimidinase n=1 Tax=Variovorax fucosicus TaxID=3053517 RepID=UPI0025780177|nr:dihydropyrimidinase [Variovorax sp. J22G47]MDM0056340.1 dihydropyrimidinase [Variovorax sp. J22G47]
MPRYDLILRNADIATVGDRYSADIGVRDGRIVAIAQGLEGEAAQTLDAAGRLVTPGGVDGHCHFDQPTNDGSKYADDFFTGTRSAACGGTTTVLPFAVQQRGASIQAAVDDYHRRADGKAVIDYAFHLIVADATKDVTQRELPMLIDKGYTSFKIYMTYDDLKLGDRQIIEVLAVARRHGAMTMIHAENSDCIAWLTEQLLEAGLTAPRYHSSSRPMAVEREATHRAIALAELIDTPILIVHVSGREAVEQIHWARGRGLPVYAETCPQYLFLSAEDLGIDPDDPMHGARCVCSPPPRDKANQQFIWNGLSSGLFTIVSSDHAPFNMEGPHGKRVAGEEASFDRIPNGIPGVETRLPLLMSEGVLGGRIDIHRFVELTSTNPARLYGLYPKKGTIAVGCDADFVVWDQFAEGEERTLTNQMLHHAVDYTPYEGMKLRAWPATTVSRGRLVWHEGRFQAEAGSGQFQPCLRPRAPRDSNPLDQWL